MRIYDKYTTFMLIFGILIMHILCFSLSIFFLFHFIILEVNADYLALVLVVFFILAPIIVDIMLYKSKFRLIPRLFAKCKINKDGLNFSGIGFGQWSIAWDDIRTYGTTGFDNQQSYTFIFFSKDPNEKYDIKSVLDINYNRIVLQLRDNLWHELSSYLPKDMYKHLSYSIDKKKDVFFKRHVSSLS